MRRTAVYKEIDEDSSTGLTPLSRKKCIFRGTLFLIWITVEHAMNNGKTPGRNTPCPCGSGKKYKRCCGSDNGLPKTEKTPATSDASRRCGECSLCCEGWVKTRVLGHSIDLGQPCPYSSGHNCTIHQTRPEDPCRIFFCGWAERNSPLPEWMRPDRCGVIVLTGRSKWRGMDVDILVSAGSDPAETLLDWFKKNSLAARRPFIFQIKEAWFGFGPPAFQAEIAARASRGEPLWT